ncbi:hypothetical protein Syun_014708 [Stephania yunnanensis]|uniref:Uncharacterized protein n=1 Tax=Stephania yunnanensis TaxID=152371 RepID=A0AAP0JLK1_9MAGN
MNSTKSERRGGRRESGEAEREMSGEEEEGGRREAERVSREVRESERREGGEDLVDSSSVLGNLLGRIRESGEVGERCELCVHDALDYSTCDPTFSEWQLELALGARVGDSADLASAAREQVLGQLDAITGGNLVT